MKEVEEYWKHWTALAKAGSPFRFLNIDESQDDVGSGDGGEKGDAGDGDNENQEDKEDADDENIEDQGAKEDADGGNDENGEKEGVDDDEEELRNAEGSSKAPIGPLDFGIDEGVPIPCQCNTPAQRSTCLQSLATDTKVGHTFSKLVKLVDVLEVSVMLVTQSSL